MYKIVMVDLDGTLLDDHKNVSKANIEMIIDNEKYYFQLKEIDGGTEISSCYSII